VMCRKSCGLRLLGERSDAELRLCSKCFSSSGRRATVRYIRFRDLRHTCASVLLMFGANLTSVQRLLGHSDPTITERRYAHLLPEVIKRGTRLRFRPRPTCAEAGRDRRGAVFACFLVACARRARSAP
jgi:integrase-like protein